MSALPMVQPLMSPGTSSRSVPLSASSLVTEASTNSPGPDIVSATLTFGRIVTSLWFGGHRLFGVAEQVTSGGVLSMRTSWERGGVSLLFALSSDQYVIVVSPSAEMTHSRTLYALLA